MLSLSPSTDAGVVVSGRNDGGQFANVLRTNLQQTFEGVQPSVPSQALDQPSGQLPVDDMPHQSSDERERWRHSRLELRCNHHQ